MSFKNIIICISPLKSVWKIIATAKENKEEVYQHHIQVTDKAISVFKDSFTAENIDPSETYVRVGAKPGGCSGWTFLIETTDKKESKDDIYPLF